MKNDANRKLEAVERIDKSTAEIALSSPDAEVRTRALLSLAYYDPDWKSAQDTCLRMLSNDPDVNVRATAALCIGHVARIHRRLDLEEVIPALRVVLDEPVIGARAQTALDDIRLYVLSPLS